MAKVISPPVWEPVQIDEAKASARVDGAEYDVLISAYITAAREQAEQIAGRSLVAQTHRHELRDWPADGDALPEFGATAVAVGYWDGSAWVDVSGVTFGAVTGGTEIARSSAWPTLPDVPAIPRVRVDITAGDTPDAVSACLRLYILASVAAWVDSPAAQQVGALQPNPLFERLLDPLRVYG